uniref:V-type proton ATPase subunit n=1 Tax=Alexandrium monilatum TaxID=311494 RepID=A0A7S4QCE5_9DINO
MAQASRGVATDSCVLHAPLCRGRMSGVCLGFQAPGLIRGTLAWLCVGFVATVVAQAFVKVTPKITKQESRQLALVVVWVSTICMWLFWAFVYMHQMVPIIYPVHKPIA